MRVVLRGQSVDLLDVENGVGLEERNFALDVLPILVAFSLRKPVGVDDEGTVLAFAHATASLLSLLEREEVRRRPAR